MGARAVLVKGGHLDGDPVDVLVDARGTRSFSGRRAIGTMRGTGDLLAATIAAGLARGRTLDEAIVHARERVARAIGSSERFAGAHVAQRDDLPRS
jgi:hydroxymethylpyrimidine/phosphomethylpyrimidine kinase